MIKLQRARTAGTEAAAARTVSRQSDVRLNRRRLFSAGVADCPQEDLAPVSLASLDVAGPGRWDGSVEVVNGVATAIIAA